MKHPFVHLFLFILTLLATTASGAEWMTGRFFFFLDPKNSLHLQDLWQGLWFSVPFLGILTAHEFGHYFMAKYHKIKATLPYYIPFWFSAFAPNFGTMGAVIRIIDRIKSRKHYFDIGIAGPLAGFVIALGVLWYGFSHLPPLEFLYTIHPEYKLHGLNFNDPFYTKQMANQFILGDNLLFSFFKNHVADPSRLPPAFEMMHYPFVFAGYLALFFTALNLIPIGQLDGGHILYGLIGPKWFSRIAPVLYVGFAFFAGLGLFTFNGLKNTPWSGNEEWSQLLNLVLYIYFLKVCFSKISDQPNTDWALSLGVLVLQLIVSYFIPNVEGYASALLFVFLLGRFLGIYHPEVEIDEPLNWQRQVLGWLTLLIFVICFSPRPFITG